MKKLLIVVFGVGISYPLLHYCIAGIGVYPTALIMFVSAAVTLGLLNVRVPRREDSSLILVTAASFTLLVYCSLYLPGPIVAALVGIKPFLDITLDRVLLKRDALLPREKTGVFIVVISSLVLCLAYKVGDTITPSGVILGALYIGTLSLGQALRVKYVQFIGNKGKTNHILPTSLLLASACLLLLVFSRGESALLIPSSFDAAYLLTALYLGVITTGIFMNFSEDLRCKYGVAFVQMTTSSQVYVAIAFTHILSAFFNVSDIPLTESIYIFTSLALYSLGIILILSIQSQKEGITL